MAVNITKNYINLREELADLRNPPMYSQHQFWFSGNGSATDFTLPSGWVPVHVYDAGLLKKEGSGDAYIVTLQDHDHTIEFNSAPSNSNDICVVAVRENLV